MMCVWIVKSFPSDGRDLAISFRFEFSDMLRLRPMASYGKQASREVRNILKSIQWLQIPRVSGGHRLPPFRVETHVYAWQC